MNGLEIRDVRAALTVIDPTFLNSPQLVVSDLSQQLGVEVIFKIETTNPIKTFKGRGAENFVSRVTSRHLVCASAGNFGQAMAYACAKRGILLIVYAALNANPYKISKMRELGADVVLFGKDFDEAKAEGRRWAKTNHLQFVEDGRDEAITAGYATIALEIIAEQAHVDYAVVPVGNGALFNGVGKVFSELMPNTKRIGVQAKGAPAMIESWKRNTFVEYATSNTIADGIDIRIPVPEALVQMNSLMDEGHTVDDQSLLHAMAFFHNYTGMHAEPSAVAGLALIMQQAARFEGKKVLTIITGANLTEDQAETWFKVSGGT